MKKINFLIVMALATQGSSLAAKGDPNEFGTEVIGGDVFFNATENSDEYHGKNADGKKRKSVRKRINRLNKARNAALEGATGQKSDEGSTDADISDSEKNISIVANQAMNLVNDPQIQDLSDFKMENKGVLSVLWGKPIVRVFVLAAVVAGSAYWLSQFDISQEMAEQLKAHVNTFSQVTQDKLGAIGNSLSNIDFAQMLNTVKSFLTNNASTARDFIGKQGGNLLKGATSMASQVGSGLSGLGSQASSRLSQYAPSWESVQGMASQVGSGLSGLGSQASSRLSQYAPSWESVQGMASQGLNWSKENATSIIEGVKGTLSDALGQADTATRYAIPAMIEKAPDAAKYGLGAFGGYNLANLKNWWSGDKDVKSQEISGQEDVSDS